MADGRWGRPMRFAEPDAPAAEPASALFPFVLRDEHVSADVRNECCVLCARGMRGVYGWHEQRMRQVPL